MDMGDGTRIRRSQPRIPVRRKALRGVRRAASFLALLAAVTAACGPVGRYRALGVSHDAAGRVQIHYGACEGEHVERVQLFRFRGEVVGDRDDVKLWEIVSGAITRVSVFTVGVVPRGFREAVPLRTGVPFDRRLGVKVYSDQTRGETQTFTLASVAPGVVYARGERLDVKGFREMAERLCVPMETY
jgi:hypothetical protein